MAAGLSYGLAVNPARLARRTEQVERTMRPTYGCNAVIRLSTGDDMPTTAGIRYRGSRPSITSSIFVNGVAPYNTEWYT